MGRAAPLLDAAARDFAVVALFLAAVGLYGVVAYTVSQRTREIGLRMAIGAQRGDVLRMVLGGGMKLAMIGVVLGTVGALWLASLVVSLLFGVTPFDPVSYAGTAAAPRGLRDRLLHPRAPSDEDGPVAGAPPRLSMSGSKGPRFQLQQEVTCSARN